VAAGFVDLMQSAGTLAIEQVVGGELAIWGTSRSRIDELIWTNPVQPVCEKWDAFGPRPLANLSPIPPTVFVWKEHYGVSGSDDVRPVAEL